MTVLFALLGLAVGTGCGNQNFACSGFCDDGSGQFEGIISASSLADAKSECDAKYVCTTGSKRCDCYQMQ